MSRWKESLGSAAGNGEQILDLRKSFSLISAVRIFILEGLVPVALAFVCWKILPDSPETADFLTKREKEWIINRMALDTGTGGKGRVTNDDKIKPKHVWDALKEYKIWCAWIMFWANTIGVYG